MADYIGLTHYAQQALLDAIANGVAPTFPTSLFIRLHSANPTMAGNVGELTEDGYAPIEVNINGGSTPTWNLAALEGGSNWFEVTLNDDITFGPAGEDWPTVTHVSFYDDSEGEAWFTAKLAASRVVQSGGTLKFLATELRMILKSDFI